MVKLLGVPVHPDALVGVTVMVAVIATDVVLMAVKLAILPVPLAANPIDGVLLVQLYTVPVTVPEKVIGAVAKPVHKVWFATAFTVAVGFTVIVKLVAVPAQPAATGVTVMVAVPVLRPGSLQ